VFCGSPAGIHDSDFVLNICMSVRVAFQHLKSSARIMLQKTSLWQTVLETNATEHFRVSKP
jgi:hypothetical protein